ncbi:MAG: dihydroorotate dehydrogenase electron transfer subunit [Planctomycetes bacterium]|nr:dihydroorotate dehydrogenase electron transfer subunit [Planctomycetota bacterium]
MFYHEKLRIVGNVNLGSGYFMLDLALEHDVNVEHGNFVMITFPSRQDLLLPRPFSVFDIQNRSVKILYKVVGKGTEYLSNLAPGEVVECSLPLGNSFPKPDGFDVVFLVGGGFGAAPLNLYLRTFLPEKLKYQANFLLGAKTVKELVFLDELCENAKNNLAIATDDGTKGFTGFVTKLFASKIEELEKASKILVLSCGPDAMTHALAENIKSLQPTRNIKAFFSLEAKMACGFGVCNGCVVETPTGYKRVCKDGPVFEIDDVIL